MFDLVIARYSENITWLNEIDPRYNIIIYNKLNGDNLIPNLGREAFTYFYHIVNNYDNLAEFTAFIQAGWRTQKKIKSGINIIQDLNEIVVPLNYLNLGFRHPFKNDKYGNPNGLIDLEWCWNELFIEPCPKEIHFCPYSMFSASRKNIKKRSKEFYEKCLDICSIECTVYHTSGTTKPDMSKGKKYHSPWIFERLFDYIFGTNIKDKF